MAKYAAKRVWYSNTHFRSTLEARWAIVWDQLDISWQYEVRKLGIYYLPDFLLRTRECGSILVEVKPVVPTEQQITKLNNAQVVYDCCGFFALGSFHNRSPIFWSPFLEDVYTGTPAIILGVDNTAYTIAEGKARWAKF